MKSGNDAGTKYRAGSLASKANIMQNYAGIIWVAIVYLGTFHYFVAVGLFHGIHLQKLHTVVTGNGFERFTEYRSGQAAFQSVEYLDKTLLVLPCGLKDKFFTCASFREYKEASLIAFTGFHGVKFPMTISEPVIDFFWSFLDGSMDMVPCLTLFLVYFFKLLSWHG